MATDTVHFFDLYSDFPGPSKSWSFNTLKIRAVLNFKGTPYTQSWMSYPDVKPLVTSLGLPPNKEGLPYTLPVIVHNSVKSNPHGAMMDSLPIAEHLDKTFPSPSLFPSGDESHKLLDTVGGILGKVYPFLFPLIIPRVPEHLDARGQVYFHESRTAWFGKPLSEVAPTDQETIETMESNIEKEAGPLIDLLNKTTGPFFEGDNPGYVDLVVACHLAFVERFDKGLFGRFMALGKGELGTLYQGCRPWLEGQGRDRDWVIQDV